MTRIDHTDKKAKASFPSRKPNEFQRKFGWSVHDWSQACGLSRSTTFNLLKSGQISSVKLGAKRIITTQPQDFLNALGVGDLPL